MTRADACAGVLWAGATAYALFGGADFGGGFWDLVAGGAERGERPRALIQRSLTPVWEANHVWLIFILVVLWTAFPPAFSAVMTTLYVPLTLGGKRIGWLRPTMLCSRLISACSRSLLSCSRAVSRHSSRATAASAAITSSSRRCPWSSAAAAVTIG